MKSFPTLPVSYILGCPLAVFAVFIPLSTASLPLSFSHFHEACSSRNRRTVQLVSESSSSQLSNLLLSTWKRPKSRYNLLKRHFLSRSEHWPTMRRASSISDHTKLNKRPCLSIQSNMKKGYIGASSPSTSLRLQSQVDNHPKHL